MAVSTITLTPTESWDDGKRIHVQGALAITPSADTYATGGLAVPIAVVPGVVSTTKPVVFSASGIAGYIYEYDYTASKLRVRAHVNAAAEDAPLGELAVAATPAGVSGDTIRFYAIYHKLVE